MAYKQSEIESIAKALNTVVEVTTDAERVDLDFVIERWDEVASVAGDTMSALRHRDNITERAQEVAARAVARGSLHSNLLEHAVLLVEFEVMKGERVYSDA